jgi:fructose PTS system EIIA component
MLESLLSCPEPQVGEDVRLSARSRADVLAQVAREVAAPCPDLDAAAIEAALQAREEEASTELGEGFAMPHAVLAGLTEPRVLNVAFDEPVQWGAEGGVVNRCVVILVPPGRERTHLKLVAQAVRSGQTST